MGIGVVKRSRLLGKIISFIRRLFFPVTQTFLSFKKEAVMKRVSVLLSVMFFIVGTAGIALAGAHLTPPGPMDPKGIETVHMVYECDTFTPGKPNIHLPGADLNGPGDSYRYTLIRDDKYANDPDYEIVNAVAGVHIDDYDWSKESGDREPEWGRILVNGKPMKYVIMLPTDKRQPESSEFIEIVSDAEISQEGGPLMPPYIFSLTEEAKKSKMLVFEVTNLRKDGSVDGDAPFGNFVVNRIGYHVWYKKK